MKIEILKVESNDNIIGFEIKLPPNKKGWDTLFIALNQEDWPNVRVGEMPTDYDYINQVDIKNKKTVVADVELYQERILTMELKILAVEKGIEKTNVTVRGGTLTFGNNEVPDDLNKDDYKIVETLSSTVNPIIKKADYKFVKQ